MGHKVLLKLAGFGVASLFAGFVAVQVLIGGVVTDQRIHEGQYQHLMRDGDGVWVDTNQLFYVVEAYKHQLLLFFVLVFVVSIAVRQMRRR